jgi:hypothetical protein
MTLQHVPVIDVGPHLRGDAAGSRAVAAAVAQACTDIGFLVITNHGVPRALYERMVDVSNQFFDLPLAAKREIDRPADNVPRGFSGLEEEGLAYLQGIEAPGDLKESVTIVLADPETRIQADGVRRLADIYECHGEPMLSPNTLAEWKSQLFAEFKKFGYVAALNSDVDADRMAQWAKESPIEFIPSLIIWKGSPDFAAVKALVESGKIKGIGEIAVQYDGMAPNDPFLEPYYALAEQYDLPVSIHIAAGAPAIDYIGYHEVNSYRSDMTRPLLLEPVLRKHPKLRLYVMHAGWPMDDEMLLLMFMHPQVHVDIAMINTVLPRKEFHRYLKILVDAGMGKRIMYGTDHAVWPQTISESVAAIDTADFLSEAQKRDIFFHNAVRFFRLDEAALMRRHAAQRGN